MSKSRRQKKQRLEQAAFVSAAVVTASVATAVTAEVLNHQLNPVDKSLWNPALFQRDVAINKMPILCAHNSGSESGGGTWFFNSNQTMKPYDILENTPVRALEFQVENDNGTLITNHGAALSDWMIDPTVSQPETFQSQIDSVKDWLAQPENSDQVIFLQVGNETGGVNLNPFLQATFGNQVADGVTWQNSSVNDLVKAGKHIVLLPGSMNDIFHTQGYSWSDYWEDRTMLGNLGQDITLSMPVDQQFVGQLNTDGVDALIKKGGVIKIDDLAPNDPRLIDPTARDELFFDPDVYLFDGLIQINRGVLSALTFGFGVFSAVGTAAFAIANSVIKAYKNSEFIQQAAQHLKEDIKNLDVKKLLLTMHKENKTYASTQDVLTFCRQQSLQKITYATLTDGAMGMTSLAVSAFSWGLLFPVAFPATSIFTLVILATGTIATVLATYFNRRALHANLDKVANSPAVLELCKKQALKTTNTVNKTNYLNYKALSANAKMETRITNISGTLLSSTILFRISSLAKYTISVMGEIAAAGLAIAALGKSALDALVNYRERQKKLADLSGVIAQASTPAIQTRPYYIFGETQFEKFINSERLKLPQQFVTMPAGDIIKKLSNTESSQDYSLLMQLRKNCIAHSLRQDFQLYCTRHTGTPENLVKEFLLEKISNHISKDVITSGRMNAFKIVCSIGFSGSFIAPAMTAIFGIFSIATMLVAEVVTRIIAQNEVNKFKAAGTDLLNNPTSKDLIRFMNTIKANPSSSATIYQTVGRPVTSDSIAEVKSSVEYGSNDTATLPLLPKRQRSSNDLQPSSTSVEVQKRRLA